MDAVFYLLLLLNFGVGAFCVVFLLTAPMEPDDPGATSLALPFFPLVAITIPLFVYMHNDRMWSPEPENDYSPGVSITNIPHTREPEDPALIQ